MELHRAKELALELMNLHGLLDGKSPWAFKWRKSRNAAGTCRFRTKEIMLSLYLTPFCDDADVKDTILHEIAHALTPGDGHGYAWQRKAREIGSIGMRFYGMDGKKQSLVNANKLVSKFKAVCKNGHESYSNRLSKKRKSCGLCSNKFNPNELLVFLPNSITN